MVESKVECWNIGYIELMYFFSYIIIGLRVEVFNFDKGIVGY